MSRRKDIPIELFRALLTISEHGNFTAAAEVLKLTQPAISAQIKRLQKSVGGKLFAKGAHGVGLTELGMKVERYARDILTLNDQVLALSGGAPNQETIRVGIQNTFARYVLVNVLQKLRASDDRHYSLVCGSTPDLAAKLRSGFLDLACIFPMNDTRRNLISEWHEDMVWVCARDGFALTDTEPVPLVTRLDGFLTQKVMKVLEDHRVPYRTVFSGTDPTVLFAAVEAGLGVMGMARRSMPESLTIPKNRRLPKLPTLRAGIFYNEGFDLKRHRALVEAFAAAMRPQPHR